MVEFVKKTQALKDCTLDATYSDMYDGTNPYLKVGGVIEPKKAILRFQIAEKPTFGDAELSHGEMGFYSTDLKLGASANYPTFNLYKIKTSPNGKDWGGEGQLRPITRGRQIVEVDITNSGTHQNSVKVENHELSTGDRVWWSPVTTRYADVDITPLVPEAEYYVIKIDRDNFSFADTLDNAIAGTRFALNTKTSSVTSYGYVRSEKYNMDIHVISATPSTGREVISENFNGSAYRETDLNFEYIQRKVTRKGLPYLVDSSALRDNPNDLTKNTQGHEGKGDWWKVSTSFWKESPSNLENWYGNGKTGNDFKIMLTSHKTNSDGTGWWRTVEDAGYWGGGHDYVSKSNPAVLFENESSAEAVPYGDEITPENSFFHVVKGATEFAEMSDSESGENEVEATGAIRLSSKKALTGGQSCNIYQFWKLDGLGIAYQPDSDIEGKSNRQECMMLYKGLPLPNKNWTLTDEHIHGHGQYPMNQSVAIDKVDVAHGSGDMCVSMTVNFEKLEMAWTHVSQRDINTGGTGLASATITNVDNGALLASGATAITIITTDETTITATAHASTTSSLASTNSGTFDVGASGSDTMTNIATLLNSHPKLSSTASGDITTITQAVVGTAGNTTITITDPGDAGLSSANFSGGVGITPISSRSDVTLRRGFHVIYAAVPPQQTDSLYSYIKRLSGYAEGAANGNNRLVSEKSSGVISACGYSIVNTSSGIRLYPLDKMRIDTDDEDIYMAHQSHSWGLGYDLNHPSATHMEEGEWYTIKTFFPETLNQQAALIIEDSEGEPKQYATDVVTNTWWEDNPIPLNNINGSITNSTSQPWHHATQALEWYQHMSIWVTNVESAYSTHDGDVTGHPGTDWMASEDDRNTSNNIFIDRIGVDGVNLDHENATVGQEGRSRSKIFISGNKTYDTALAPGITTDLTYTDTNGPKWTSDKAQLVTKGRTKRADNIICLGFEDPSQILSDHRREKSWRYLFWHGYTTANQGADNKISWTSDGTLPLLDNKESGTTGSKRWFSRLPDNQYRSTGRAAAGTHADNPSHMETLDAGAPYTFSEFGDELRNSVIASYGDAAVTLGAQFSDESLDIRELWRNHTADDDGVGRRGAKQPMYSSCPSIGALFDCRATATGGIDQSDSSITLTAGPNNGTGVYWNTGQKVIYYNLGSSSVSGLTSANGKFTDVPTVYYWERFADDATGDNKGFLHLNYADAINKDVPIDVRAEAADERHILYDYDYYMNRKYWVDGWSSKGLSRLILEPVEADNTINIRTEYLANTQRAPAKTEASSPWAIKDSTAGANAALATHASTPTKLDLVKREHVACAAKMLEFEGTGDSSTGYICRVDSTEALRSVKNTTYRIWIAGQPNTTGYYASGLSINIVDEEHIEIQGWNGKSDDNSLNMTQTTTSTGTGSSQESSGLSRLWIGPEKYWISFLVRNQSGDTEDTFGNLPLKTYSAVSVCSPFQIGDTRTEEEHAETAGTYDAWGVPGATYNEFTYNADKISGVRGAYINKWQPSPNLDPNQTIYDLADYGYGNAKEDKDNLGGENGVIGGYVGKFIPRESQVNRIKMPKIFSAGESKTEGDYVDLAIQQETLNSDAIMTVSSTDNGSYPTPFLLTVFEDELPEAPMDFEVEPNEKDAFLPEFTWTASDGDLWYGFIIVDDTPINNQYHRSILHAPLDEDLSSVVSSYDDDKGWYYSPSASPIIYGYRYSNKTKVPSGIHKGNALASPTSDKILATSATLYDNVEGLAGNTKYFDTGSHVQFPFHNTSTSSGFTYPIDEMSILVHITPESWGANRYIAAFNNPDNSDTPSWSLYLDDEGQINATVGAKEPHADHPTHLITLKSATKVPVDGTPTCIILTVDSQIHSGNVKLYINGRLEDQSGLRGTLSINNWSTHSTGLGGEAIYYDTDGLEDLIIGAKNLHATLATRNSFIGRIEEFVWYDKVIYPVLPQDGTFVLDKPLEELADTSQNASSKSYTARLFIKDYHNIRGKTNGEVAASSQLSFRKAAFELRTN